MPSPQKVKGKSFENAKAKFLTEIFGEKFIRVPTSGAFLGGQNYDRRHSMTQGQVMAFKGDIIPPDNWLYFNCECKFYKDFKFHLLLNVYLFQLFHLVCLLSIYEAIQPANDLKDQDKEI